MNNPTHDHGPFNSNTSFGQSSATNNTVHFGPHFFPNTPFPAITAPPISMESVLLIFFTVSDCPALFQNARATRSQILGLFCLSLRVQNTILIPFSRVVECQSYGWLNTKQVILLQEARCIPDTKKRVVRLSLELGNVTGEKPIALLAF